MNALSINVDLDRTLSSSSATDVESEDEPELVSKNQPEGRSHEGRSSSTDVAEDDKHKMENGDEGRKQNHGTRSPKGASVDLEEGEICSDISDDEASSIHSKQDNRANGTLSKPDL